MAGDWIKMRKSLLGDPRVVRISSALRADRFRTIGGLFSAWCLLDEQTADGHLDGYSAETFDDIVGIKGIASAMASVGWLEIGDGFIKAPGFFQHNGQTAKRRAQDSVRKLSARDADKTRKVCGQNDGLEKRREEKSNTPTEYIELPSLWNKTFGQKCELTESRAKSLKARLKNPSWVENWRQAIAKASESSFCRGKNKSGWKADLEWFLRPDTVTKIMEGKYDDAEPSEETSSPYDEYPEF